MEELKRAFYEVMYKYEKSFSEDGVMENLRAWADGKASLLALLRRHPNWEEDAKAIVLPYDEGRGIEHDVVDEISYMMLDLADTVVSPEQQDAFHTAFNAAVGEYASTLREESLACIRSSGGIKCASGQKTSRIIGRLCVKFHVDRHPNYNAVFARLSDALNPLKTEKTAVLSVHPCDFLEMSNKDNTWTSCHNLENGSYQSGALSYMIDDVSMVFYTVDPDVTEKFYHAPRRTRQMFFYQENMLYQSRLYPNDASDLMDQQRGMVQQMVATCLNAPNLWVLKTKRSELSTCCESGNGSQQYPDYEDFGNLSILKGTQRGKSIVIGKKPICVCCGRKRSMSRSIKCDCEERVVCSDCGRTILKAQSRFIERSFHCNACLHICAVCGQLIHGTPCPAFDRRGGPVEICHGCYQSSLAPCAACSVQRVCSILGNSLCPRTAVTAVERRAG